MRLASEDEFNKVGAPRPSFLTGLSFTPVISPQGSPVILVADHDAQDVAPLVDANVRFGSLMVEAATEAGVERVLELLETEIRTCLGLLGVCSVGQLDSDYLHGPSSVVQPAVTSAFPLLEEGY